MNTQKNNFKLFFILKSCLFLVVFTCIYFSAILLFKKPSANNTAYLNNNLNVFGLNIPSNLTFCGEILPLDNYEIRKNLEKEFFNNVYWKNNSSILFNKVERWFPYIEPILKQQGVPDDLKYIALIESHLSNKTSPAGASGFWQLLPATAISYGLIVNEEVDERKDVERSTYAACMLFKAAYAKFNNWTLSAAAYNIGIGGLERAMDKQKTTNYYDLLLNKETGEFIYRILAYKTLISNSAHFGINYAKRKKLTKIPVKIYTVDSTLHNLTYLAKKIGCSKAQLKLLNPWLKTDYLNNPDGIKFQFKIPKNLKIDYSAYYIDLNSDDGYISSQLGSVEAPEEIELDTSFVKQEKNKILHVVKPDETLKKIADFYCVNEAKILSWNNLNSASQVTVNLQLIIYTTK